VSAWPLPALPEDITPAWLTAALRETGALNQAEIAQVTWERIGDGRGLTGILARLRLGYASPKEAASRPLSLIAKFPMASQGTLSTYRAAQQHDPAAFRRHYERCAREVWFYQTIAPFGDVPTPRCYYGAADEETGNVVLLLEDMQASRAGDVLQGCSVDEAAQVLHAIAPLHARWWVSAHLQTFSGLAQWVGDVHARQDRYTRQVGPFLARFGQQLPAAVQEVVDRLRFSYARVLTGLAEAPQTLIHADLHLDNLFFSPPGQMPPVTVLDWQSACLGPAAVDVALFLFGSLPVEPRRVAADALLQDYHRLLGARGVSGYSAQQVLDHCRLALLWQMAGTVGWLSAADLNTLQGRERALVEAALGDERLIAALQDYDVLTLLSSL
jgi:aminoglycoside phosphotransferase (APT) family kinase protein